MENAAVDSSRKAGSVAQLVKKDGENGKAGKYLPSVQFLSDVVNLCLSKRSDSLWAVALNVAFSCSVWLGSYSNHSTKCPALHLQGKKANALV